MSIVIFQLNLNLIQSFAVRLNKESMSFQEKKVLLKSYSYDLNLNLTDNMIKEVLVIKD